VKQTCLFLLCKLEKFCPCRAAACWVGHWSKVIGHALYNHPIMKEHLIVTYAIAIVGFLAGFIGAVLSGNYSTKWYPPFGQNWVDTWQPMVWPCMFLAWFSALLVMMVGRRFGRKELIFLLVIWSLCALAALVNAIGLFISHLPAGGGWYLGVTFVCLVNVAVLVYRRTQVGWLSKDEQFLELERVEDSVGDSEKARLSGCAHCALRFGVGVTYAILVIAFVLLVLNCWGSWTLAAGVLAYPPPGGITATKGVTTGLQQNIHWQCAGTKQPGRATIVLESDGSHGVTDFYCLFESLAALGRRVCIWDKPGLGWSGPIQSGQDFFSIEGMAEAEAQFISALPSDDRDGLIALGWGGGGGMVVSYASKNLDKVKGLGFIDVYPPNFEWDPLNPSYQPGAKESALASRNTYMEIIRSLGVPTGLMSVFVPPSPNYMPASKVGVQTWTYRTWKTWTSQAYYMLNPAFADAADWTKASVGTIPLLNMITAYNTSTMEVNNWACKQYGASSKQCQQELANNAFAVAGKEALTAMGGPGSKTVRCTEPECNQGSLIYGNGVCNDWTAKQIAEYFRLE